MRAQERHAVVVALLATDAMMLLWALALALTARYGIAGWPGSEGAGAGGLVLFLSGAAVSLALMVGLGLYRVDELFCGHRAYAGVLRACTFSAFAVLFFSFLLDVELSRGALVLSWGFTAALVGGGRAVFSGAMQRLRRSGRFVRRALIAGTDEHAVALAERLAGPRSGWQVVGFLDDYRPVGTSVTGELTVLGDPCATAIVAERVGAGDVILVPHAVSWEAQRDLLELVAVSDRLSLHLAPGFYHLLAAGARPVEANDVPLLSLERLRITGIDGALKVALDYGISLATLPVLGVTLGLLLVAGRMSGGGPVLERRPALGLQSRPFDLLLLTPPPGSERPPGAAGWAWRARRAVAASRWRKLPILLNVLGGHMSLIGPRALPAAGGRPQHRSTPTLLLVRPGLTGPCHAEGGRWSVEEQAIADVAYVRNYSFWLDLRLLLRSLLRTLRRERALPASYQLAPSERPVAEETAAG